MHTLIKIMELFFALILLTVCLRESFMLAGSTKNCKKQKNCLMDLKIVKQNVHLSRMRQLIDSNNGMFIITHIFND